MTVYADRVLETTTTSGIGNYALGGPVSGYQSFADALSDGAEIDYLVEDVTAGGSRWEIGTGTFHLGASDYVTRDTVHGSSTGAAIDWPASGRRNIALILRGATIATLLAHLARTDNPHEVTAEQAGAQPANALLTALAALATAADKLIYLTGENTVATTVLTEFVRGLLAAETPTDARSTLEAAPSSHVGAGGDAHAAAGAEAGFMSAEDKTKLDGIEAGAEVNTVTSVHDRTGAVTAEAGDYSADQVVVTPAAGFSDTDVQAVLESLPFTQAFVSAPQAITSAGALTLAHGLWRAPTLIQCRLKCTTSEANYSVDDEIVVDTRGVLSDSRGFTVVPDGVNLIVRFGSAGNVFVANDKTSGAGVALTNGNWQFIVRAWA